MKYPPVALAALLCLFALKQWAQSVNAFFSLHGTLTNYLVASIVIVALVVMFFRNKPILASYPPAGWLVLALFSYSLMSILWVSNPEITYKVWLIELPYIITIILLSPLLISSTESISEGLMAFLPLGTLLALLLLFTSKWTDRGVELMGISRLRSQGNPLAVAEMAGYLMSAVVLLNFKGKWRTWQFLRWFIAAACLALAAKSGSRGQFFTMMLAAAVYLPMSRRITNPLHVVVLIVGLTFLAILGDWAFHSFSTAGDLRWQTAKMQQDVSGRFTAAFKLLEVWYKSPSAIMFGLGNSASFDPSIIGFYPHVVPLEILGEEGIVGFFLFLTSIGITLRSIFRSYKIVRFDSSKRGILAVIGAIFSFELLLCLKQGSMFGSPYLFAFMIILGKYELLLVSEQKQVARLASDAI